MPRTLASLRRSLSILAFPLAVALPAAPLAAQDATPSDTAGALPFRAGQWATQFSFDGNVVSAGALRFRSQRTAWVLDAFGEVTKVEYESSNVDPSATDEMDDTDFSVGVQLGLRRYRAVATRVNAFAGAGLIGQSFLNHQRFVNSPEVYSARGGAAGLYGEVGATWMVSRNFGLSGSTALTATYDWSSIEQPGTFTRGVSMNTTGYTLQLRRARLNVIVFF